MKQIVAGFHKTAPGNLLDGWVPTDLNLDSAALSSRGHLILDHNNGILLCGYERIVVRGVVGQIQKFGHFKRG